MTAVSTDTGQFVARHLTSRRACELIPSGRSYLHPPRTPLPMTENPRTCWTQAGGTVHSDDGVNVLDATRCCWPDCTRAAHDDPEGPPLCGSHVAQVAAYALSTARAKFKPELPPASEQEATERRRAAAYAAQSLVYYVRIGDHVKIGYTTNLKSRLTSLRIDAAAILATEPGGGTLESERHAQFKLERVGRREDFNPSPRLLAHIASIRQQYGDPVITTHLHVA